MQAYIPHPLSDGDTIQFGEIFGIFRLLEDDNDLPMTQALDVPETPVRGRGAPRVNEIATTTIPESPDVSDRVSHLLIKMYTKALQEKRVKLIKLNYSMEKPRQI